MDANKNILEIAKDKGYYIDREGNAFSKQGQLKLYRGKYPYWCFGVKNNKKTAKIFVHRLQAFQKFGNELFESGIEVRHLNNDKNDNSYKNISIGTRSENVMDNPESIRRALHHGMRKHDHEAIQMDYRNGLRGKKLMEKYNLTSRGGLHYILNH